MSGQKYIENGKAENADYFVFPGLRAGTGADKSLPLLMRKIKKYWEDRVETFADAPDLLLAKNESQITEQRFCRRSAKTVTERMAVCKKTRREDWR